MNKYIALFLILFLSGCGNNDKSREIIKSDTVKTNTSSLIPLVYKGMYHKSKGTAMMTECGTDKKFLLSSKGDIAIMDSVYNLVNKKGTNKKLYVNVEGFISVQQSDKKKGFDTVLVVTKTIGSDTTFNCER